MPVNIGKEDLRCVKTEKALNIAMFSLLENRNFGKITVSDICGEALISRATFYAYFSDKYDLLKDWLIHLLPENISNDEANDKMGKKVNCFISKNENIIKNLMYNADDETLGILFESILNTIDFSILKKDDGNTNPKYIVLSNFYAGGMLFYINWHVKNKFPSDIMPMNVHLDDLIMKFKESIN